MDIYTMILKNKHILITGGNSGIGFCLAKQLHALGNSITVVSRSQKNWQSLQKLQPEVRLLRCDLSKKLEVLHLIQQLNDQNAQTDVLINCAAIQNTPHLVDSHFSFDDIEKEVNTNFTAVVWLSYLLLPRLLSRPEAGIVNLSSGLALFPKAGSAVYCASKAAIHNFSQSLRYQLNGHPLCISEVILPLVDTPMTQGRGKGKISPEAAASAIIGAIERNKEEIYVGKARLLPPLIRLWPGLVKHILSRY